MLTRLVRLQLGIFAVVTVLAVGAISTLYLHAPSRLGLGTYKVTADFLGGGGIYKSANVTYRGVTVGRVADVYLTDHGVDAEMRLNSSSKIPGNVTATVKSMSAIGEQYIDLVPPTVDPGAGVLRNGARIGQDRTAIGQDIAGMLDQAQSLVNSISSSRIRDLLRSAFEGFNGSGQELARMIASSRQLVDEANANFDVTAGLIDQVEPFLDAQIRSGDDIRKLSRSLAAITTEVSNADPQLRETLQTLPSVTDAANTTFDGIRASFPSLAASIANFGRVGVIYRNSIEQALVVFPALMAALMTVAGGVPMEEGAKLDFKVDLHDPPPCSVGFLPFTEMRSPADETVRELPKGLYCKAAQNDPSAVRGARNYPCMEHPGKRAPTIQICRDPQGYVPIGSNPWRGPPVPYDTPITDPRMQLPMNKFPYIPPSSDYDPGPPVVALPPGVPAGPGPAPNPPYPLPYPPAELGPNPPAPWPYYAPPDQNMPTSPGGNGGLPPYGRDPAPAPGPLPAEATGVAYSTYDQRTGKFVDPAGNSGVFVSGSDKYQPAQDWAGLMLAPSQT
ncbi:MCE family protein [Mycolicibacter minnesotensis]